jgi:hypothetical protein
MEEYIIQIDENILEINSFFQMLKDTVPNTKEYEYLHEKIKDSIYEFIRDFIKEKEYILTKYQGEELINQIKLLAYILAMRKCAIYLSYSKSTYAIENIDEKCRQAELDFSKIHF